MAIDKDALKATFKTFATALLVWGAYIAYLSWSNPKYGYSLWYNVPESQVFIDSQPHDCEWDKAPIGNKYCHYEKTVTTTEDAAGNDNAVFVKWTRIQE